MSWPTGRVKKPAGYLRRAIEEDWGPPPGYLPRNERERLAADAQQAEHKVAEQRRQEQEVAARKRADDAAVRAYWESLTPEEQDELDADARAQADPETLAMEEGPLRESLGRIGQQLRRDACIRQRLQEQGTPVTAGV